jgi:hypothetical protein
VSEPRSLDTAAAAALPVLEFQISDLVRGLKACLEVVPYVRPERVAAASPKEGIPLPEAVLAEVAALLARHLAPCRIS